MDVVVVLHPSETNPNNVKLCDNICGVSLEGDAWTSPAPQFAWPLPTWNAIAIDPPVDETFATTIDENEFEVGRPRSDVSHAWLRHVDDELSIAPSQTALDEDAPAMSVQWGQTIAFLAITFLTIDDVVFATPRMASIEIGGGANRIRLIVAVHAEIVPSVSVDHAIVPTVAVSATVIE